jgi:ferredoxin
MRAVVEADTCVGCELCVQICPDVFSMQGEKAVTFANPIPAEHIESAKEAAEKCPVDAISIE